MGWAWLGWAASRVCFCFQFPCGLLRTAEGKRTNKRMDGWTDGRSVGRWAFLDLWSFSYFPILLLILSFVATIIIIVIFFFVIPFSDSFSLALTLTLTVLRPFPLNCCSAARVHLQVTKCKQGQTDRHPDPALWIDGAMQSGTGRDETRRRRRKDGRQTDRRRDACTTRTRARGTTLDPVALIVQGIIFVSRFTSFLALLSSPVVSSPRCGLFLLLLAVCLLRAAALHVITSHLILHTHTHKPVVCLSCMHPCFFQHPIASLLSAVCGVSFVCFVCLVWRLLARRLTVCLTHFLHYPPTFSFLPFPSPSIPYSSSTPPSLFSLP
ncbi:hypothetical protein BC567DRAFT_238763 [Phyllosticta citribraziliensis]